MSTRRIIGKEDISIAFKEGLNELSIPTVDDIENSLEKHSKGKYMYINNKLRIIFIDKEREDDFDKVTEAVKDIITALLTGGNEEENIKRMKLCDIYSLASILYTFGAGDRKLNTLIKLVDWLNKE